MDTIIRRSFIFILAAALFAFVPFAVAGEQSWTRVATEPSRWGALSSPHVPIAICTGDTQLNFSYQPGMEKADFESRSLTRAGEPYTQQGTEVGWKTSISASDTGKVAAMFDLWGTEAVAGIVPEAFTLAVHELTADSRGIASTSKKAWQDQARKLLEIAAKIAGPHKAGELTFADGKLSGFTVIGQAGVPLVGVPFSAELSGATWESTGEAVLTGTTGAEQQSFAVTAPAFGEVTLKVTYSKIPGHSFATGHHSVAQDLHMRGERGAIEQNAVLRNAPSQTKVSISTKAAIKDSGAIRDLVTVSADEWPKVERIPATFDLTARLYGPFEEQLEEQEAVPDGVEAAETVSLSVIEPGTYEVLFDHEPSPGWYTVVVDGHFRDDGDFAGLPQDNVAMPFFEPDETVFVEPEPEPEPTPEPTPEPMPEPTPEPTPESTPEPTPTPAPQPKPEPTPVPAPEPKPSTPPAVLANTGAFSLPFAAMAVGLAGLGVTLVAGARSTSKRR